ncbi:uncharacterized protein LOC118409893 [Branchiostoma floridae]|uniref:Uncharacterized protein LOC118409893 n=1 Tax=Branchiostoma floridae TaxID=7739 RepID=A0A9J7MHD4_BRAFL|nr:uncharacterized protein LOC118409893 [Branchiostoma floridae]
MAGSGDGSIPGAPVNTVFTVEPKLLQDAPEVLLCCVNTHQFPIHFSGVSCIEVVTRRCHIAVPGDPPSVRRLCLMPDRNLDSLFAGVTSPVKLRIKSSSTIDFECSKDADRQQARGTLLWDTEILPTDYAASILPAVTTDIPADLPYETDIQPVDPNLPYPDHCNCQMSESVQSPPILCDMQTESQLDPLVCSLEDLHFSSDGGESDDQDLNAESEEDEDTDNHAASRMSGQIFSVVGSTWHTSCQAVLDKCEKLRREGEDVKVQLAFEPTNIKDRNAIVFEMFIENTWQIVGYCPGPKVPKVTRAMRNGTITEIVMHKLTHAYCFPAKKFMYKVKVKIVKRGSWEGDATDYRFNSVIV